MKKNVPFPNDSLLKFFKLKLFPFLLLFMAFTTSVFAQTTVTGVVKDDNNQVLAGVSVQVKNTKTATLTDGDGKFTIKAADPNAVIVFSFIGYNTQQQSLRGRSILNVKLAELSTGLNQVVVIGYGTTRKKDLTGAVGQVSMPDISKAPVRSIDEALAGRIAGVQVSSSDGQPGAAVNIVVRGANSITQDNSPLYVIDGFPVEGFNLNVFNPQDIESLEVLKDASATAIYGARGANGVVIITTKKGKAGNAVITFNTTQSFSKNINTMELMDSYDFLKYQLERDPTAGSSINLTPTYSYLTVPGKTLEDYRNVASTDWQSPFFRTGSLRNYALAIRGGTDKTLYSVSGSIDNQDGTIINTGYARYQGRITLDQTINDKLKVGVNANYAHLLQSGNSVSQSTNSATTNVLYSVWGFNPLIPYSDNQALDPTTDASNDYKFNPVLNQRNIVRNIRTDNLNVNTYINYTIVPNLVLRVTGVLNNSIATRENFNNSQTYYGSALTNAGKTNGVNGSTSTAKVNNWANENTLTYNKTFNKVHNFNAVVGFTEQGNTSSTYGFGANFLPNESLGISGMDEGTLNPAATVAASSLWRAASVLSRVSYNYNSLYYLTLSYRADGSSKFSEENHWGYFPSAAVAWRFSQEKFLKDSKVLSDGKLRLSYGKTGNNRVGDFSYLSTTGVPAAFTYSFNNAYVSSIKPLTVGNPNLKWETTAQYDGGVDLGFLDNRISFTADVYRKKTENLLLNASIPTSTGYNTAITNVGSVQNQGLELTLNTTNVKTKNFSWSSSFNISFNRNKVLALANGQESLTSSVSWDNAWSGIPAYIAKVGQPLGLMYGYVANGVYQYADFNQSATGTYVLKDNISGNGNTRTSIQPGDVKYKDLNGDGTVNASDYTVIGHSQPVHTGGFSNNFTYKNFDLNLFFQWSYGNEIQNINRMVFEGNALSKIYLEQFASYNDRWSPANQQSANYRAGGYYGGGYSSLTVEDGSYLRLKTASVGYNLPKSLLKRMKIAALRVYVSGQNLYTWTKYSGLDPEVDTYNSVLTGGFDYSAYPRARTIAFGANLTF